MDQCDASMWLIEKTLTPCKGRRNARQTRDLP